MSDEKKEPKPEPPKQEKETFKPRPTDHVERNSVDPERIPTNLSHNKKD